MDFFFLNFGPKVLVGFAENMAETHEGQRIYRMCLQMDKGVHYKVMASQVYADLTSRLPNDKSEIADDLSVLIRQGTCRGSLGNCPNWREDGFN